MSSKPTNSEKIHKRIAASGAYSRRHAETLVAAGRVRVNKRRAQVGERVGSKDRIEIDGKALHIRKPTQAPAVPEILLYHKPVGEICSRSDEHGRPTVYDSLPACSDGKWISIGRLDFNTSGVLLFSNDGYWANRLSHPSAQIEREYTVRVQGKVTNEMLKNLREGVMLDDGMANFSDIQPVTRSGTRANNWFYVVLMSGRNREVKRLWESQDVRVSRLKRVRFGNIILPSGLRAGRYKSLNTTMLNGLLALVNTTERLAAAP